MDMNEAIAEISLDMEESIESLNKNLSGIRTGRADPGLLDSVKVEAYGSQMPINQMATVVAEGPATIKISPWDKTQLSDIEKAIQLSDIGIQPSSDGYVIRLNLPPMTEERRLEFVKLAKSSGENTKISIRNARRKFLDLVKQAVKDKDLTEDDDHRAQSDIQKITDGYIERIDAIVAKKEQELLKV